jgi:hypothetical protein
MGWHGPVNMAMPNGRHGTIKQPTGSTLGRQAGTKYVQARHDWHDSPRRHDAVPGRHGTAR